MDLGTRDAGRWSPGAVAASACLVASLRTDRAAASRLERRLPRRGSGGDPLRAPSVASPPDEREFIEVRPWLREEVRSIVAVIDRYLEVASRRDWPAPPGQRGLARNLASLLGTGESPPLDADDDAVLWAGGICATMLALAERNVEPSAAPTFLAIASGVCGAGEGPSAGDSEDECEASSVDVDFDFGLQEGAEEADDEDDDSFDEIARSDRDPGWWQLCQQASDRVGLVLERPPLLIAALARTVQRRAGMAATRLPRPRDQL